MTLSPGFVTDNDATRILIRASNWIGDSVMTMPAVQHLRELAPEAYIAVLCPGKLTDLWRHNPFINEVIPFGAQPNFRDREFDLAVIFPNSFRSAWECKRAGIPRRIGYAGHWRRFLLTDVVRQRRGERAVYRKKTVAGKTFEVKVFKSLRHQSEHYLDLVAHLGGNSQSILPRIYLAMEEMPPLSKFLRDDGRPVVGINAGAEYGPAKRWPAERFAQTAIKVSYHANTRWLIFGGPQDIAVADQIETQLRDGGLSDSTIINVAGKTTLLDLCALLRFCKLLLTNDTGPMHIAAAIGTPVVSIWGSTSPELTGPLSPRSVVIRQPVECSPCFLRECPIDFRCMEGVQVDEVVKAVLKQLGVEERDPAAIMSEQPSVARSARTVSLAVLGSRVLGLVREQVLAALFGANREFDAFLTAFRIPNLLRDLFAEGALSAAFVTTFSQKLSAEGDKSAWRLANLVLNALILVLTVIMLVGVIISPLLVRMISPGFSQIPGKVELTTTLTRIMFPFLLMVALAALAMGMLNAKHRFGVPASASMMFNIGSVLGGLTFAFLLAPGFLHNPALAGRAVIGMSIGTLIGGALQWIIQIPSLRKVGYRYEPILDWHDPGFRQVLRLLGPSVIGTAAIQSNIFVDQWFASWPSMSGGSGSGAVSWLNCSFRLMQFPIGVFGVAIATATLPTVSAHAVRGDMVEFRKTLARSIRLAFFLCVPAACGLWVLATPIISVIYQHGKFDAFATAQTAACVRAFSVGLVGYAAGKIIAPTFYALGDSRTPMYVTIFSVIVNAGTDYLFAVTFGMKTAGLALSTSTVALCNFFLLLLLMRRKIGRIEVSTLLRSLVRIGVASALMSATTYGTHHQLQLYQVNRYMDMLASIGVALIVFGVSCKILNVTELGEALGVMRFGSKQTSN